MSGLRLLLRYCTSLSASSVDVSHCVSKVLPSLTADLGYVCKILWRGGGVVVTRGLEGHLHEYYAFFLLNPGIVENTQSLRYIYIQN